MKKIAGRKRRLLAVASAGGHWIQLLRLTPAFSDCDVAFVSTLEADRAVEGHRFYKVPDANRWNKIGFIKMTLAIIGILLRERPDVVISTGAAPGYAALRLSKLLGSKTIWVDSLANVDKLSMSGALVGKYADLWLTQWQQVARESGPHYRGRVV